MKGVVVIAVLVAMVAATQPRGCPKELSTTLLPDFKDCASFWRCAGGVPLRLTCPSGLHFSPHLKSCTMPVLAHCQDTADDVPTHAASTSGFLDTLLNILSRKAQPVPPAKDELRAAPEQPSGELPQDLETLRRFPDTEAEVPELPDAKEEEDGDVKEAENSKEAGSEKEGQKPEEADAEGESDAEEEIHQEEEVEGGKRQEQDESERSEEKIDEEEDEVAREKEESESSDIGDVVAEDDAKKDTAVLKKKEEEEEDDKKESKDVKSIKNENKNKKSEEKEKDSDSDAESDDEE